MMNWKYLRLSLLWGMLIAVCSYGVELFLGALDLPAFIRDGTDNLLAGLWSATLIYYLLKLRRRYVAKVERDANLIALLNDQIRNGLQIIVASQIIDEQDVRLLFIKEASNKIVNVLKQISTEEKQ